MQVPNVMAWKGNATQLLASSMEVCQPDFPAYQQDLRCAPDARPRLHMQLCQFGNCVTGRRLPSMRKP